jgi:hypothetical protein
MRTEAIFSLRSILLKKPLLIFRNAQRLALCRSGNLDDHDGPRTEPKVSRITGATRSERKSPARVLGSAGQTGAPGLGDWARQTVLRRGSRRFAATLGIYLRDGARAAAGALNPCSDASLRLAAVGKALAPNAAAAAWDKMTQQPALAVLVSLSLLRREAVLIVYSTRTSRQRSRAQLHEHQDARAEGNFAYY